MRPSGMGGLSFLQIVESRFVTQKRRATLGPDWSSSPFDAGDQLLPAIKYQGHQTFKSSFASSLRLIDSG
jgi:hypothetical protein